MPAGSVFAGRRLEADGSISVTFESGFGTERAVRFAATGVLPFIGTSGDVDYLEFGALGSVPTLLDFTRFGTLSFSSPTQQVVAFYGGFETPTGAGPTAGTLSYQGGAIAAEQRGATFFALAGSIHLEADFTSNTIYGSINNLKRFDDNGAALGDYDYRFILSGVSITNAGGSRTFNGGITAQRLDNGNTATNGTSLIIGRFFGNAAQEAAGVWQTDVIAGRDIWGSFGATTNVVSGTATFLQSVGTPLALTHQTTVEINQTTDVATTIASPAATVTPLANGGLTFSDVSLGTFNPPGSSTAPHLDTTGIFVTGTNAVAVSGASGASPPSFPFLAERGTLSYARFGYWIDTSRASSDDVFVYNYFATGVQTPGSSMPSSGTATYAGTTVGKVVDATNTATDFFGKVNLTANFGTATISGSVHSLESTTALPLTGINLNSGTITNNTFAGGAGSASAVGGVGTGTWQGTFHGPAANELAGTYTLNGGGGSLQAWGSFGAGR
ncbi:MAG: transferrin-binding protein-like solute binding protein [Burkholderiales bacterium]|nr:transferrin-binding protein-like solute binding protein [Burkholderiales bacterium]